MELPLVLAGPILRRVDPGLVAVWMAFSEPVELILRVWEGRVAFDTTNDVFASSDGPHDPSAPPPRPGTKAVRVGERLYLGMVTARIPPASGKSFQPNLLYSYDVRVIKLPPGGVPPAAGEPVRGLGELGMLETRITSGVEVPPLGYADRMLPSFALPPSELDDLRIAYGSCRRPLYDDGDALAWIDGLLISSVGDPRGRVHQLFLGGDQIYADDVGRLMMPHVIDLGVRLIGRDGPDGPAIERIKVGQVMKKTAATVDPETPWTAYTAETATETAAAGDLPAGSEHFPPGNRLKLTQHSAQFTSGDGDNHLISFGEFAALYLMVWSPACWGETVTGAEVQTFDPASSTSLTWLKKDEEFGEKDRIVLVDPQFPEPDFRDIRVQDIARPEPGIENSGLANPKYPERIPEHLFGPPDPLPKALSAEDARKKEEEDKKRRPDAKARTIRARRDSHRVHRDFLLGLGKVQRVLANVPTYMIFDDHDVTDDLFLNPLWRRRVLGSPLGQVILTNAMLAYALFQDWGNDPRRYDQATDADHPNLGKQLPGDLLVRAPAYFAEGQSTGPDPAVFGELAAMFGHDIDNQPDLDGRFRTGKPPLTWHFSVDGPKHQVVALDNRTRRSFASEIGPPGNVSPEALVDQLPQRPLEAGREVLIVIAPLQVIGPGVLDELVSPAIYRIFDAAKSKDFAGQQVSGSRQMPGTNPDALETWALEPLAFEHLLKRLAEFQRVVLLSGDVHNSTGNVMSYWRGTAQRPARIAQFTSSGFKNVMPVYLRALDRSAMLLQELLRAKIGVERFGWDRPADELVLLPEGRSTDDLVAATRAKLLRSPVLLPAHGWLDDNRPDIDIPRLELSSRLNPAKPPDWRWRVQPLLDERADRDILDDPQFEKHRPPPIQAKAIDDAAIEAQLADPMEVLAALQTISDRHQAALGRMRNARQMLFRSNFGICRFETEDGAISAVHEVYTEGIDPETRLRVMDRYMVQKAPLGPPKDAPPRADDEPPPARLRVAAIEPVPVPAAPQP
ncbi:hypothetical protein M0208_06640 [Sphingomonas sp. SUN019]|uniref:hypothetical protein n=1 Tax=Sphingomonas sp. SUN019 TaxID=2937788 RepID=UPI0021646050|nr:hypothetical protein [Sphingomonas sp. SUN019]UVO50214.1 hypothetical protein M0208_06640 [Sphingomonas sp. SUN019]